MGGFFSSPPAPDTSAADKARADAEAEKAKLKAENDAKLRNRKSRSGGRALLAFADEQGVVGGKSKLGE